MILRHNIFMTAEDLSCQWRPSYIIKKTPLKHYCLSAGFSRYIYVICVPRSHPYERVMLKRCYEKSLLNTIVIFVLL